MTNTASHEWKLETITRVYLSQIRARRTVFCFVTLHHCSFVHFVLFLCCSIDSEGFFLFLFLIPITCYHFTRTLRPQFIHHGSSAGADCKLAISSKAICFHPYGRPPFQLTFYFFTSKQDFNTATVQYCTVAIKTSFAAHSAIDIAYHYDTAKYCTTYLQYYPQNRIHVICA